MTINAFSDKPKVYCVYSTGPFQYEIYKCYVEGVIDGKYILTREDGCSITSDYRQCFNTLEQAEHYLSKQERII